MSSKNRLLTLDVGSSKIVLAEFTVGRNAVPTLTRYAVKPLDSLSQEASVRSLYSVSGDVREMMIENGIKPAPMCVSLSGQAVFPRFVKLPPVEQDKIDEMLLYEAQENLPFPVEEVVWDYQVVADTDVELDALIVATKRDTAQEAILFGEQCGVRIEIIDAIPFTLYNSMRFNYSDEGGCTMLLDIGARSMNLIFVEGAKVFTRSIPVAGNTITNDIARSLSITPAEAEALKKDIGVVALGGNYAVMGDETADKVSKVIRNVVTRLHSEVTRSINFYRSQQDGSVPNKLYLTGGASLTRHMDTFFREKLDIDVEYLNPFVNVPVASGLEDDQSSLFLMAPVVGLALRGGVKCPLEINLLPREVVDERRFARRLPFFGVAVVGLVLTLLCWFGFASMQRSTYTAQHNAVSQRIDKFRGLQGRIDTIDSEMAEVAQKTAYITEMAAARASYSGVVNAVRDAMIPGTWLRSITFERDEADGSGYVQIVVRGYKIELDKLVSARGGSASELLLGNLRKNAEFFETEGSRVLSDKVIAVGEATAKVDLSELSVRVKLKRTPGVLDANWSERMATK